MVQVVQRIAALVGAFTVDEPELRLAECADRAGLNPSSALRLLRSMAEVGFVERTESGRWRLGGLTLELAAVALSQGGDHQTEVRAGLRRLGQRYGAATAFSVPNGSNMIYVERTESPIPYAPSAKLGTIAPIWAGAAGRAVLASMRPSEMNQRLSVDEWHSLSKALQAQILTDIDAARSTGYSVDWGKSFDGVGGVAVAIGSSDGPIAAISLIMSPERLSVELAAEIGGEMIKLGRPASVFVSLPLATSERDSK